jgi:predicted Rossmann fold flavoprotein
MQATVSVENKYLHLHVYPKKKTITTNIFYYFVHMKKKQIAIIGAGASGMIAAITAARNGAEVTLFERNDRVGKKLLATGNGQCNLTNSNCDQTHFHGEHPSFVNTALSQFSVNDTIAFFNALGALTISEPDGKVYPRTLQASTILDLLRFELERSGISVKTQTPVDSLHKGKSGFTLHTPSGSSCADAVIVTCGSKAAPHLGGNGSGIELLVKLGHSTTDTYPVLVPLKTDYPFSRHLKGTKIDATITVFVNGRETAKDHGELLFTDYGLSGPPIIQLSIPVNEALHQKKQVHCEVDIFPDMQREQLTTHLQKIFTVKSTQPLETALIGFVNKRLISSILTDSGCTDQRILAATLSTAVITAIASTVKAWRFTLCGSLSWNDAHVSAGGVRTSEFNTTTLESKMVRGLYAAGEILDITGDCGGYNLQWAWSSGYLAAYSAVKELQ